jgi:hypothetical protein
MLLRQSDTTKQQGERERETEIRIKVACHISEAHVGADVSHDLSELTSLDVNFRKLPASYPMGTRGSFPGG